ncbi:MAG: DEAD/DEAH box helicase [bacterium]|nr:DEAD/DEAH box helicase [bacterium]
MLPSVLAAQLIKGLEDYLETTFPMTNAPFLGSLRKMLTDGAALCHKPFVSVRLPFRTAAEMPTCFEAIHPAFLPYVHQQTAFGRLTGEDGRSTLIATGTGSGKTECFLYPILEYCYRHRGQKGIKALLIYPMNALATDQAKRLAELIWNSPELRGNVTAGMYVGGQGPQSSRLMSAESIVTDRQTMLTAPPDILLTNYKMLDYLLVRPKDAALWQNNKPDTLKYIAVDELHTFDGAQGTDLACLLRRLKFRLGTPGGYLCCVGTSATMGSPENGANIVRYAEEIFGEPFEPDSIVAEDRLTPEEFFADFPAADFTVPTAAQSAELRRLAERNDAAAYLRLAAAAWTAPDDTDVLTPEGRIALGRRLMRHGVLQSLLKFSRGRWQRISALAEALRAAGPSPGEAESAEAAETAVSALLALISHARTGTPEKPRPFLNVQISLWLRELRRLVARVSDQEIVYATAHDLNAQQSKRYLPVLNCRDCGATGWAGLPGERMNASVGRLETFYNLYFKGDGRITALYPCAHEKCPPGLSPGRICPNCLQVSLGRDSASICGSCGEAMIEILLPNPFKTAGTEENKHFVCPFCGSEHGLTLVGLRSATEISAELVQIFASGFNDDKKALAFSDSVQDAAHRAGFFNARTWRFGLRTAIQRFAQNGGAGQSLAAFSTNFSAYWRRQLDDEHFAGYFTAPNMTWYEAYANLLASGRFGNKDKGRHLIRDIEKRLSYEIMLEYGLTARIGRTLEKSGCSCLEFPSEAVSAAAAIVRERAVNEIGGLERTGVECFERMIAGYLRQMAQNGAFDDDAFALFLKENGKSYLLSNDQDYWRPGLRAGVNVPRFLYTAHGQPLKNCPFDSPAAPKYTARLEKCCREDLLPESAARDISRIILEELVKNGIVVRKTPNAFGAVYALNKDKVSVTDRTAVFKCSACGLSQTVAASDKRFWQDSPCVRRSCPGLLTEDLTAGTDYYGRLFSSGSLSRINAREHTGLLERGSREKLENEFKQKHQNTGKKYAPWESNVLSCTPTLEMGIDIGDLSTVILCGVPPSQAQYLQRTGRAGRRDGNALTLTAAAAKPHDLYFYADPPDMMDGDIVPPKVFLKASAVLERQFAAFCLDSWVKSGASEQAIPKNVSAVLRELDKPAREQFPFNFMGYVRNNRTHLLNAFMQMFSDSLDGAAKDELRAFAQGQEPHSPMHRRILEAFRALEKQRASLSQSFRQLKKQIKELESRPEDTSLSREINELKNEQNALLGVIKEIDKKDVFNFMSDEGLLPNYAFPEAGIVLKAVLYRKSESVSPKSGPESETGRSKPKAGKTVYEYSRSAAAAISEFAPRNRFYADGRKLTVDQVDLVSAQAATWRLCPNCSHAQLEESGKDTACCPRCGSPAWADVGQLRNMLKVQMVYSSMDAAKSRISDDSDDRSHVFYCRQLLADVDEDRDVTCAYKMNNGEFPFGYEFVRKAVLRDINFGESDLNGDRLRVAGVDEVRKGFRVCRHCGRLQPEQRGSASESGSGRSGRAKEIHAPYCKMRGQAGAELPPESEPFEECLFLYREFTTEALRLLIPATTMDTDEVRKESFTAAFMLGMKEYFGNVDHLQATVSEVPLPYSDCRKQYLVIYDSVPGGTGYLKQLMNERNSLIDIFAKALQKLETCPCGSDPQKDGCYHCLYAYRQSRSIGSISRTTAIRLLKAILSGKNGLKKIPGLSVIKVNTLLESELERLFIQALEKAVNERGRGTFSRDTVNGKEGYILKINGCVWTVEPQVPLDSAQGVAVKCRPDFVIWPQEDTERLPAAVFTDGFDCHKDITGGDILKREAVRRSGRFRVWTLSWHDAMTVLRPQGDYYAPTLDAENMPSGTMYGNTVHNAQAKALEPGRMTAFELLMQYLERDKAETEFAAQARAYSLSLLEPSKLKDDAAWAEWRKAAEEINGQTGCTEYEFSSTGTFFGSRTPRTWQPGDTVEHLFIYAGIPAEVLKKDRGAFPAVFALLDDGGDRRGDSYKREWNGFWHFYNAMQFNPHFAAVCRSGLDRRDYCVLNCRPGPAASGADAEATAADEADWEEAAALITGEEERIIASSLKAGGIPAPDSDDIGYEVEDERGVVAAEMAWAWPEKRLGYMTGEQLGRRDQAERAGWTICTSAEEIISAFGRHR